MAMVAASSVTWVCPALPVMLQNAFTSNVIAQTGEWPHNNGLCAYSGMRFGEDTYWFFLQYLPNRFKIANQRFNNWVIAGGDGTMTVHDGGDCPDQYWAMEPVDGQPSIVRLKNLTHGIYAFDPNSVGETGELAISPLRQVQRSRFEWALLNQPSLAF
ncbi:MAG: hypothetical protein RLO51_08020 [Thalassobaculum sp.]|uniref:hypothetical protein n=1 Tax=Thalassobaculum sp. TaxID=2022740 RepID=UPI0032ECDBEB